MSGPALIQTAMTRGTATASSRRQGALLANPTLMQLFGTGSNLRCTLVNKELVAYAVQLVKWLCNATHGHDCIHISIQLHRIR